MSQHAGLFFPEREWPVEEDIQCFFVFFFISEATFTHYHWYVFFFEWVPAFSKEKAFIKIYPVTGEKKAFSDCSHVALNLSRSTWY